MYYICIPHWIVGRGRKKGRWKAAAALFHTVLALRVPRGGGRSITDGETGLEMIFRKTNCNCFLKLHSRFSSRGFFSFFVETDFAKKTAQTVVKATLPSCNDAKFGWVARRVNAHISY